MMKVSIFQNKKHPETKDAAKEVFLPDEIELIHPIKCDNINAEPVRTAAIKTKCSSGPSGMDADGWHRNLTSNCFRKSSSDLCKAFTEAIKIFSLRRNPVSTQRCFTVVLRLKKRRDVAQPKITLFQRR